jgi:Ala-tRNA(Pro) deacylase
MQTDKFLTRNGVSFQVLPHRATYDAQRMAQTLHVPGDEVAKTVLLRVEDGATFVVAVLPATRSVDLCRAAEALGGGPVELATENEIVAHCPDCEAGVLPPFGSQYGMRTLVDRSLTEDEEIIFEANTHDEAIRMRFEDFRELEQPLIASFVLP